MVVKKGPYGSFLTRRIDRDEKIYNYALEVLQNDTVSQFLPVYLNSDYVNEVAFEFSGMIPIDEYCYQYQNSNSKNSKASITARKKRRIAVGNLFLSISRCPDLLLPLSAICLDTTTTFTDVKGEKISICYIPTEQENYKEMNLDSIGVNLLEKFLSHVFFDGILSDDETSSLLFSFKENDEEMLRKICKDIINDEITKDIKSPGLLLPLSITSAIFALPSLLLTSFFTFFVFLTISLITFLIYIILVNKKRSQRLSEKREETSKERKKVLFSDNEFESTNNHKEANDYSFTYAILKSVIPINSSELSFAIYTSITTIGSDRFLSDLFIDDTSLSTLHAKIILDDRGFYICDVSKDNTTYINNMRLKPQEWYQLKSGQTVRFGNFDFDFTIVN